MAVVEPGASGGAEAEGTGGTETTDVPDLGTGGAAQVVEPVIGIPAGYTGTPFSDVAHAAEAQKIPGRVEVELYDFGGPDVAYKDDDAANNGSGNLNPENGSYLNEFRKDEAVDTSYTKSGGVDDSAYNMVDPEMDQLYVGWTGVGEWVNITVNVETAGLFSVSLMYTCNGNGSISLLLNDQDLATYLALVDTNDPADTTGWRQWHHWNKMEIAQVNLPAGTHLLKVLVAQNGNMNLDYLEFSLLN
jgi:hypothetical protein